MRESSTKHITIPITLCQYMLKNKLSNVGSLYCYLIFSTSGNFRKERLQKVEILNALGVRKWSTIEVWMKKLEKLGWMYRMHDAYFLKSLTTTAIELEPTTSMGAMIYKEMLIDFKAFIIAGCIAEILRKIRRREAAKALNKGRTTGRPLSPLWLSSGHEIPRYENEVANIYLANNLGLGLTSGHKFKKMALDAGFISISSNIQNLKISKAYLNTFQEDNPHLANRCFIKGKWIQLNQPQRVKSNIRLRSMRILRKHFACQKRDRIPEGY